MQNHVEMPMNVLTYHKEWNGRMSKMQGLCEVCDMDFSSWFVKDDGVLKQICSVCADDFREDRKSAESFSASEQKACHRCGTSLKKMANYGGSVQEKDSFVALVPTTVERNDRAESFSADTQTFDFGG